MSAENNEFSIPFEESRRASFSDTEKKAAAKRLGSYLASRAINRPTIGESRGVRRRRGRNMDLPTGGKPGTREPTGTSRDPDNDGWVDEGTTRPRWVGLENGNEISNRKPSVSRKPSESLSSGLNEEDRDYRGQHSAPDRDGGAPLHDLAQVYPGDVYSRDSLRSYGTGEEDLDREAYAFFLSMRGKPDAPVTIYRAVPKSTQGRIDEIKKEQKYIEKTGKIPRGARPNFQPSDYYDVLSAELLRLEEEGLAETPDINPGDWVTPFRKYAVSHGNSALRGEYQIISKRVRAKDIFTDGNSWLEWGYDPADNPEPRGEVPDSAPGLSSGRKYQEIVDSQPELSREKKQIAKDLLRELRNPSISNPDTYKREEDPFGDMIRVVDNSPQTLSAKKKIYDLVKSLFQGEVQLDRDIIVTDKDGNDVNIGKTVRIIPRDVHRMESNAYGVEVREEAGNLKLYVSTTLSLRPDKSASRNLQPGVNAPDSLVPWDVDPGMDRNDKLMLGSAVRTFVFDISNPESENNIVMHNTFSVSDDAQGYGIGSAFNARNEKIYNELGLSGITTSGGSGVGQNGAVHWPKNGFTWADESAKLKFLRVIKSGLKKDSNTYFNDEEKKRISSLIRETGDANIELESDASPEELLNFGGAEKLFADKEAIVDYRRELQSSKERDLVLSSGSQPIYPTGQTFEELIKENSRTDYEPQPSVALSSGMYNSSAEYNDGRGYSRAVNRNSKGKAISVSVGNKEYEIKTSSPANGRITTYIEDSSGRRLAYIVLDDIEGADNKQVNLHDVGVTADARKNGALEALLDSLLINNPSVTFNSADSEAKTTFWIERVSNKTNKYGISGERQKGFRFEYFDGEPVSRDGDYVFESELGIGQERILSRDDATGIQWSGRVFNVGNERVVFGAPEGIQFDDDSVIQLPLNPFEITGLDESSQEGRQLAEDWMHAINGISISLIRESFGSDGFESSYASALLYAAINGDDKAKKEFDSFASRSKALIMKMRQKQEESQADITTSDPLPMNVNLVHQTSYEPSIDADGWLSIKPLEDFPMTSRTGEEITFNRGTVHFTINHLAKGHMGRTEAEGASYVIVANLDDFMRSNPDSLENLAVVDTAATPPPGEGLRLAPGTFSVIKVENGENARELTEKAIRSTGQQVFTGGERESSHDSQARERAMLLGLTPVVASDLALARIEFINRSNIKPELQYSAVPSSTALLFEASRNALLRVANRRENRWVSFDKQRTRRSSFLPPKRSELSSGAQDNSRPPSYPREPTYGAFIGRANDMFDGVRSWEEFRDRYNDQEVIFFDYETTGLVFDEFRQPSSKGAPVQFGAVKIKNGREIGRINLFMNPDEQLGEWSRNNLKDKDGNPLTDEWLAQQMSIEDAHRQLIEFAGQDAIFGVQNASFDKDVLDGVLKQMGETWKPGGWIDTRELAALVLPRWTPETDDGPFVIDRDGNKKPSSSLAAITEYLGVELGDGHHNADVDAFATSEVMRKMIDGAIENGWSTDALDKSKRDSILKQSQDKFAADIEQFEKSKNEYLDGLSSGARLIDSFENTESTDFAAREKVINSIEESLGISLTDEQRDTVSLIVPWAIKTINDKTLLDVEPADAFKEDGKRLLESIEVRISSDGIPFISADPIPQIAEQIPDKRDWRNIEIPPISAIEEIMSSARQDFVTFDPDNRVWLDVDGNIVARVDVNQSGGPNKLKFESAEAEKRFPLLAALAPKGRMILADSVSLGNLSQDTLPGIYGEAWQKYGIFLTELAERAGALMGDKEALIGRADSSTTTFINGYVGGITNPRLFNMGLLGKALQHYHDLFGHLGTGRGFDRHGEWANDLAMMSIVDHPDSPLSDLEKLAVKHTIFQLYSQRLIERGRVGENTDEEIKRTVRNSTMVNPVPGVSTYAGDFNKVIEQLVDASTTNKLSSGAKKIKDADKDTAITALTLDALGLTERNSDISGDSRNLSSGRERPIIPMRPVVRPVVNAPDSGYGKLDSSGRPIRRTTNTWLKGMSASEMAELLVPQSVDQIFEMWADDMAPLWRDKPDWEKALRQYFDEFYNEDKTIELDFSPESIEDMRSVLTQSIESSPGFKWLIENHGAPIIGIFSRDASLADAEIPRVRENYERLMKERGWTVPPFTKGRSIGSLEMIGLHPRFVLDREAQGTRGQTVPARLLMDPDRKLESFDAHIDGSIQAVIIHEYGHWLHRRALRNSETTPDARTRSYYGSGDSNDVLYLKGIDVAIEYDSIKRDMRRITIHSDLISAARQSPETAFRMYPDIPLTATSYGNVNKYESIAEGLVAIVHPSKEIRQRAINKKLRNDLLSLIGIDSDSGVPWDSDTGQPSPSDEASTYVPTPTSARLSSGAGPTAGNSNATGRRISTLKSLEPQEIISIAVDSSRGGEGRRDMSINSPANRFAPPPASSPTPNEEDMMSEESVDRAFAQNRQAQMGVENYKSEAAKFKRMVAIDITERIDVSLDEIFKAFSMIEDDVFGPTGSDNEYLLERISPIHPALLRAMRISDAINNNTDEYISGVTSKRLVRETISESEKRNAGLFGVSKKGEIVDPETALFSISEHKQKLDFINAATELIDELEIHDAASFGSLTPPLLFKSPDEPMEERISRAVSGNNLSPQDKMLRALIYMATQAESENQLLSMSPATIAEKLDQFLLRDSGWTSILNTLEAGRAYLGTILSTVAKHSTKYKQYLQASSRRPFGETRYVGIPRVRLADKTFGIIDADLIPFNPSKGIINQLPFGMEAAQYLVHVMPGGFFKPQWVEDIDSPSFGKLNEDRRKFNEALIAYSNALGMPMDKLIQRLEEVNNNGGIELIDSGNVSGTLELKSVIPSYFKSMLDIGETLAEQESFDRSSMAEGKAVVGDYTVYDIGTPEGKKQAISLIVSDIVHSWAISSNDRNPLMLAIQHEARQMFGLEAADGWNAGARRSSIASQMTNGVEEAIKISDSTQWQGAAEDVDDSPRLSGEQVKVIRAVLKAMYDSTQEYYRSKGITHVPVWRGLQSEPPPQAELSAGEIPLSVVTMRPLSSWSYSPEVARSFSGQNNGMAPWDLPKVDLIVEYGDESVVQPGSIADTAVVMKTFVPVEQILSNAYTGFGCLEERELVLLGKPTIVSPIIAPPGGAFMFSSPAEQLDRMEEIIEQVEKIEDNDAREKVMREGRISEIREFIEEQARTREQYERLIQVNIDELRRNADEILKGSEAA